MDDSDEALLQRIAAADRAALRMLLERHARRALALARNTLGNRAAAEDVVQEAFVRVWQHAARFDPARGRFTTWLHRIVLNLCLDDLRKPAPEPEADFDGLADSRPDALGELLARERRHRLHDALRELPVRQRAAVVLFHFQGASLREAAAALDLGEKAFESLLTRARAALREALDGDLR